jgi:ABC-2 type transport system ATP-binding protein
MSLISIQQLFKTYRGAERASVAGITLTVEKGEFFGLLGPNGAGKTTTMSILCGLLPFDSGIVKINGLDVTTALNRIKPFIGVVPQEVALYSELTIDENLRFYGGMYHIAPDIRASRTDAYLEQFSLTAHRKKKIAQLSGGMKRMVNLIAALLHKPSLLILDEPTVGVDVHSRQTIARILQTLHSQGMTIVYTSHDMKEAEQLCTRTALMNRGALICDGKPEVLVALEGARSLEELFINKTDNDEAI